MYLINANNQRNLSKDEAEKAIYSSSGVVKLVCGNANSAAHLVMLRAHDEIKRHPAYRHAVKRQYKKAVEAMEEYRRNLLHPSGIRFFHMQDMDGDTLAKYHKGVTDREYFEFWEANGAQCYERTKPFITSLQNKYRLSLVHHGISDEQTLAWAMTACATLSLAAHTYRLAINDCVAAHGLSFKLLDFVFHPFDLQDVFNLWRKAVDMTDPRTDTYDLDEVEESNIQMGLNQLREEWLAPRNLYGSTIDNINDYGEIFRSKRQQKIAASVVMGLMRDTEHELKEDLKH